MILNPKARQQPFNPRTADWTLIGNHQATTTTVNVLADTGLTASGQVYQGSNVLWQKDPDVGGIRAFVNLKNSAVIKKLFVSHATDSFITMRDCTADVPLLGMSPDQFNGACLGGSGVALHRCHVKSRIDGVGPTSEVTGNPSVIDQCWIEGPGFNTYRGYPLAPGNIPATVIGSAGTTGAPPTDAQFASATMFQASTVYAAGAFIGSDGAHLYQVSTGGTTGANITGWPITTLFKDLASNDTTQPFATGPDTLKLIYVGDYMHADGVQVGRYGALDITRTKIAGFQNSAVFIQSSAQAQGLPLSNDPAGPIRIVNCDIQALSNMWVYVNSIGGDTQFSGAYPGRWVRTAGVWSALSASPWFARPEGVTITGNLFRNRVSDGRSPQFNAAGDKFTWALWGTASITVSTGVSGAPVGDYPVFVRTEDDRQAGVTRQWSSPGVIDTTVLEARFQKGIFPGACDARSWIVWRDNIDEAGALINPLPRAGASGFDSQGYYTGT